jgi:hypothetical protein
MHQQTSQVNISPEESVHYDAINGHLDSLANTIHGFADTIVLDDLPFDVPVNSPIMLDIKRYLRISSDTIHNFANTFVGNFQSFLAQSVHPILAARPFRLNHYWLTHDSRPSAIPGNMVTYWMDKSSRQGLFASPASLSVAWTIPPEWISPWLVGKSPKVDSDTYTEIDESPQEDTDLVVSN